MLLARLSENLRSLGRASLHDLATSLDSAPAALEGALATLERKGRVRKLPPGSTCGRGCGRCDPTSMTIYEWIAASD